MTHVSWIEPGVEKHWASQIQELIVLYLKFQLKFTISILVLHLDTFGEL